MAFVGASVKKLMNKDDFVKYFVYCQIQCKNDTMTESKQPNLNALNQ